MDLGLGGDGPALPAEVSGRLWLQFVFSLSPQTARRAGRCARGSANPPEGWVEAGPALGTAVGTSPLSPATAQQGGTAGTASPGTGSAAAAAL